MTPEEKIQKSDQDFKILFDSLLKQKLFDEAQRLSEIYHNIKYLSYEKGIEFMKNLYNK